MDLYDSNASISFISGEMLNLLRYLKKIKSPCATSYDFGNLGHCSIIDIPPDKDAERIRTITTKISSIECLEDQLSLVKDAKILTVHIDGQKEDITIDNTISKLIIVIGNVINIHLTLDDPNTVVFHRTFNFGDDSGLVVGDKFDDLKPTYNLIKGDNVFPEVFQREEVKSAGIIFVTERNRSSLLSGQNYSYIIDPGQSLNAFKDAKIVAFRNNLTYEPEITSNISVVHGKPTKFKQVIESEKTQPGCIIMMNMSIDELKSFIEHRNIRSYETTIHSTPTHGQGFSLIDDIGKSISPARTLLMKKIDDLALLDELVYKIDNPFTFAFVKKRNPDTYKLLTYNIISHLGELSEDNGLVPEKLRIILASKKERDLDQARENRCKELLSTVHPGEQFIREYPRIDAFSTKRNAIRSSFSEINEKTISDFIQQKQQVRIDKPGSYLIENSNFVTINVETINAEMYVRDCGLLFVRNNDRSIQSRLHIIGNVHTIMCCEKCQVVCYFAVTTTEMREANGETYLFCSENETDTIGRFFDDREACERMRSDATPFIHQYRQFLNDANSSNSKLLTPVTVDNLPKPTITRVKSLYHEETRNITNKSLVHIDNIIQL
jgi:hypothetical protein